MSLDDIKKMISECRQNFDNTISKQVPALIEKAGALYRPMAEKMERSKNKSDAKNKSLQALDMGARYRDLEVVVRGFVKKFGNKEDEEEAGGGTSPTTPPAVEDK